MIEPVNLHVQTAKVERRSIASWESGEATAPNTVGSRPRGRAPPSSPPVLLPPLTERSASRSSLGYLLTWIYAEALMFEGLSACLGDVDLSESPSDWASISRPRIRQLRMSQSRWKARDATACGSHYWPLHSGDGVFMLETAGGSADRMLARHRYAGLAGMVRSVARRLAAQPW